MPTCNMCNFIIGTRNNPSPCVATNSNVDPWAESCNKFKPFEDSEFDFDACGKTWVNGRIPRQRKMSEDIRENCIGCPLLNKGCS